MTAYYRNRETGLVQSHPQSGLGEFFNADEIGEDGQTVKPRTSLAPSAKEIKDAKDLMKDHTANPKTTKATSGSGDSKEGDQ